MARQFTFKTTRDTEWLEDVLNNIPRKDRSAFLREMITLGLQQSGYINSIPSRFGTNVVQMPEKYPTEVTQNVTQRSDNSMSDNSPKVTQTTTHTETDPDPTDLFSETKEVDLDSALDGMNFDDLDAEEIGG